MLIVTGHFMKGILGNVELETGEDSEPSGNDGKWRRGSLNQAGGTIRGQRSVSSRCGLHQPLRPHCKPQSGDYLVTLSR